MMCRKKGQADILRQAPAAVILLVVIAVVIGVGSQVLDTVQTTQDVNDEVGSVVNETLTVAVNTFQQLDNIRIDNTSVTVTNGTGDALSFEMLSAQAVLGQINVTDAINDGLSANVSYSFTIRVESASFNATADGLSGLTTFSGFQPTIAVIVVAVIVIGLLLGGFALVQRRRP